MISDKFERYLNRLRKTTSEPISLHGHNSIADLISYDEERVHEMHEKKRKLPLSEFIDPIP